MSLKTKSFREREASHKDTQYDPIHIHFANGKLKTLSLRDPDTDDKKLCKKIKIKKITQIQESDYLWRFCFNILYTVRIYFIDFCIIIYSQQKLLSNNKLKLKK